MARVVVITPNPAVDITYRVDHQQVGTTMRVNSISRRAGGKGINVARALSALGHHALCVAPLGGTSGSWIRDELVRTGLTVTACDIDGDSRSTVAITDGHAHPTLLSEPGPLLTIAERNSFRTVIGVSLLDASYLVISGSLPRGLPPETIGDWIADAQRAGVSVLVDTSGPALLAAAAAHADILKPNELELLEATGAQNLGDGVCALQDLGASAVVVSRGAMGIYAFQGDEEWTVPAIPGITGNPTGAGDAATAGLVSGLMGGLPLLESIRRAAALGAAAVLSPVAGEIDMTAYASFLIRAATDGDNT